MCEHHINEEDFELLKKIIDVDCFPVIFTNYDGIITHVNQKWLDMCGYTYHEIIGQSTKLLQGPETNITKTKVFKEKLYKQNNAFLSVINYKKDDTPFIHNIFAWKFNSDLFIAETYA